MSVLSEHKFEKGNKGDGRNKGDGGPVHRASVPARLEVAAERWPSPLALTRRRFDGMQALKNIQSGTWHSICLQVPVMRRSRKLTLNTTGLFHKMWRGHNREHIFAENREKLDYLEQLGTARTELTEDRIDWYAFNIMNNHTHELGGIKKDKETGSYNLGIEELGNWMRRAHGCFGAGYNKRHARQGKVAYDRPKTCEIEDKYQVLRVMFYSDANPVRAGIVAHPSKYPFSSYHYYAHGTESDITAHLTPPEAYLELGRTPEERQRKYRQLCDEYLREQGLIDDDPSKEMEAPFIGSTIWRHVRRAAAREAEKARAAPS